MKKIKTFEESSMPAGREMDALIAQKVMGKIPCDDWEQEYGGWGMALTGNQMWWKECEHKEESCYPRPYPRFYSTNMSAAWEVVEKMQKKGGVCEIVGHEDGTFWAYFNKEVPDTAGAEREYVGSAQADTAPLAICRAALLTVK